MKNVDPKASRDLTSLRPQGISHYSRPYRATPDSMQLIYSIKFPKDERKEYQENLHSVVVILEIYNWAESQGINGNKGLMDGSCQYISKITWVITRGASMELRTGCTVYRGGGAYCFKFSSDLSTGTLSSTARQG
ncbi:hypothetical protein AVEN_220149-1 [Araneus ventricosus]|uniref:Uncharacterized protein n=1 Tax=Araneus ventricosus TaxID=182803 RepID=A0A4Y2UNK0_ARAVE|nr:hypothetical protein AVEN_220149-1 [Araneus ventricosus]